jgi:hypothetical protein
MNRVRLATQDECEAIKATADLDPTCTVFALDTPKGTGFAVRRIATELDPVIAAPDWDMRARTLFFRDLETVVWSQGAPSYYFNVHAPLPDSPEATENQNWINFLVKWGAQRTSTAPEFRFKKNL